MRKAANSSSSSNRKDCTCALLVLVFACFSIERNLLNPSLCRKDCALLVLVFPCLLVSQKKGIDINPVSGSLIFKINGHGNLETSSSFSRIAVHSWSHCGNRRRRDE